MLDPGYSEGRDVVIEWRSAGGDYARGPELVASLLKSNVDVLIVSSTPDAQAAKRATSTTPIVVVGVSDPVGSGLAASLAHPGGNITGLSMMITDISAKRLQLLKEAIPQVATVAVVWNPDNPNHPKALSQLKAVARSLSIELSFVEARAPEQLAPAFSAVSRKQAKAIYVLDDAFLFANRAALLKLAAKARLPLIYGHEELAHEGALMSYGPDRADLFRRSAHYVDRLLRGAKPSDLPIEQPTKFELIVNLKTAKTLGLTIPRSFLERADEVIQ
jgi:putative ABC transport system substrate-binding protein